MKNKKKILYVCHEFYPLGGGGEVAIYKLLEFLKENENLNYEILTSYDLKSKIPPKDLKNVTIHTVPIWRYDKINTGMLGMLMFLVLGFFKLRKLLKSKSFDLIHYWYSIPAGVLSLIHSKKIPYIVTLGGGDIPTFNPGQYQLLHKFVKPINKYIVKNSIKTIAMSQYALDVAYQELGLFSGGVVYNGSNNDTLYKLNYSDNSEKNLKIIIVTRLVNWKKADLVFEAIKDMDNIEVDVIGDGPELEKIKNLSSKYSIKGNFLGVINNEEVYDYLKKSDLFVLPSIGDSFGIVYVEAMSCGLPVIGAEAGGVPEVIENGVNGFLVKPNDKESLRESIVYFLKNKDKLEEFGIESKRIFEEKFHWKNIYPQYEEIYFRIVGAD